MEFTFQEKESSQSRSDWLFITKSHERQNG